MSSIISVHNLSKGYKLGTAFRSAQQFNLPANPPR